MKRNHRNQLIEPIRLVQDQSPSSPTSPKVCVRQPRPNSPVDLSILELEEMSHELDQFSKKRSITQKSEEDISFIRALQTKNPNDFPSVSQEQHKNSKSTKVTTEPTYTNRTGPINTPKSLVSIKLSSCFEIIEETSYLQQQEFLQGCNDKTISTTILTNFEDVSPTSSVTLAGVTRSKNQISINNRLNDLDSMTKQLDKLKKNGSKKNLQVPVPKLRTNKKVVKPITPTERKVVRKNEAKRKVDVDAIDKGEGTQHNGDIEFDRIEKVEKANLVMRIEGISKKIAGDQLCTQKCQEIKELLQLMELVVNK